MLSKRVWSFAVCLRREASGSTEERARLGTGGMHLGAGTLKAQCPAVTTHDPGQPGSLWRPWPDLCHCRPSSQLSSLESRVLLANSSVLSRLRTCYLPWISSPNQRALLGFYSSQELVCNPSPSAACSCACVSPQDSELLQDSNCCPTSPKSGSGPGEH